MNAALIVTAAALIMWPEHSARARLRVIAAQTWTPAHPSVREVGQPHRSRPLLVVAAALSVAAALALGMGVGMTASIGIIVAAAIRLVRRERAHVQAQRDATSWIAVLDTIHADALAGTSFGDALRNARRGSSGSVAAELDRAIARDALGGDVAGALLASPTLAAQRLGEAFNLATQYGIPLAEILSRAAADIAGRAEHAARTEASLAGPRATAIILTFLPLLGVALGQAMGANPLHVLNRGVLGGVLCVVGAALIAAGLWWTAAILNGARSW